VSESADTTAADPGPTPAPASVSADAPPAWTPEADRSGPGAAVADRPEVAVSAAFAGGFVLALILRRLAR
jgi:hypothetical protein